MKSAEILLSFLWADQYKELIVGVVEVKGLDSFSSHTDSRSFTGNTVIRLSVKN